jgi:hypothetical protein
MLGRNNMQKRESFGRETLQILEKIIENLEKLNEKMDVMIGLQKHSKKEVQPLPEAPIDISKLFSQQVSRSRAVESAHLNHLVNMKYLKKERKKAAREPHAGSKVVKSVNP